jgi:DNA-binding transcriptional regulator YiaG
MKGDELRQWRERYGLTLEEFAREIGINLQTLWRWEQGRSRPSRHTERLLESAMRKVEKRERRKERAQGSGTSTEGQSRHAVVTEEGG